MNMHHLRQTETFLSDRIKKRPYDSFDEKDIERGAGDFIYRRSRPDTGALVRKKSDSG